MSYNYLYLIAILILFMVVLKFILPILLYLIPIFVLIYIFKTVFKKKEVKNETYEESYSTYQSSQGDVIVCFVFLNIIWSAFDFSSFAAFVLSANFSRLVALNSSSIALISF